MQKKNSRWLLLIPAILIQICLGVLYAWPIFTEELFNSGYTRFQTQLIFSANFVTLPMAIILAGRLLDKIGTKVITFLSATFMGLAYLGAGLFGAENFLALFFCLGIFSGIGIGLGYTIPILIGLRWFPEKKGLITGLTVAGFGLGSSVWIKFAGDYGLLIEKFGIDKAFMIFGTIFFLVIGASSFFMRFPKEQSLEKKKTKSKTFDASDKLETDLLWSQMLKKSSFYITLVCFTFSTSAGLMVIGLMKLFPVQELSKNNAVNASIIAANAMALFFAPANSLGRIIWGRLSDHFGALRCVFLMLLTQSFFIVLFPIAAKNALSLYLISGLIGLNYGGNFALFPLLTTDLFGQKNFAQNYGFVIWGWGFGGIIGPMLGGLFGDLGIFRWAFYLAAFFCLSCALAFYFTLHKKIVISRA